MRQIKKFLCKTLSIMSLFLITCCSANEEATPIGPVPTIINVSSEYGEASYLLKDNVLDISNLPVHSISLSNDSIISISKDIVNKYGLRPGIVLLSGPSEALPYGIANRIISEKESGTEITYVTSPVSLDNIFDDLKLSITEPMVQEYGDSIKDEDNNSYPIYLESVETKASIGNDKLMNIGIDKDISVKDNIKVNFKGGIKTGYIVRIDFDLKQKKYDISFKPTINYYGYFGIKGSTEGKHNNTDFPSQRIKLFNKKGILSGIIQIGPIVLRPYVDIENYIETRAKGEVGIGFDKTNWAEIGFNSEKGSYFKSPSKDESDFITNLEANGELGIAFITQFNFGLGLYTRNIGAEINPSLKTDLSFNCDFDANLNKKEVKFNPTVNLDVTAAVTGRLKLEFFNNSMTSNNMNFANIKLLSRQIPMIPQIEDFQVMEKENGYYECDYTMSGGILSTFASMKAHLDISDKQDNIIDSHTSNIELSPIFATEHKFRNLKYDDKMKAIPIISVYDYRIPYDAKEFGQERSFDFIGLNHYDVDDVSAKIGCGVVGVRSGEKVELICSPKAGGDTIRIKQDYNNSNYYEFKLSNLKPSTTYTYQICVLNNRVLGESAINEFTTDTETDFHAKRIRVQMKTKSDLRTIDTFFEITKSMVHRRESGWNIELARNWKFILDKLDKRIFAYFDIYYNYENRQVNESNFHGVEISPFFIEYSEETLIRNEFFYFNGGDSFSGDSGWLNPVLYGRNDYHTGFWWEYKKGDDVPDGVSIRISKIE